MAPFWSVELADFSCWPIFLALSSSFCFSLLPSLEGLTWTLTFAGAVVDGDPGCCLFQAFSSTLILPSSLHLEAQELTLIFPRLFP